MFEKKIFGKKILPQKSILPSGFTAPEKPIIYPTSDAINIENIANSLYMNKKFPLTRLWQKCCFNPKSSKELLEILKKKKSFKFENKKMSKLIDDYCIGNPSVSASHMLLNFFKDISKRNNVT